MKAMTENFDKLKFDKSLFWKNEPKNWCIKNNSLTIEPDAKIDYWQKTYYGFQVMNAPSLVKERRNVFSIEIEVAFDSKNKYDQAGLLVYINDEFWI